MASEPLDYQLVLADAEAKQAALAAYISTLRSLITAGVLNHFTETPGPNDRETSAVGPGELPVGAFTKKSIPAAIKLYLTATATKRSTAEIAAALKEGGVESLAKNFQDVVRSALGKLKSEGEVCRFPDGGWKLREHIPAALRSRLEEGQKTSRPNTKAKLRKQKKRTISAATSEDPIATAG